MILYEADTADVPTWRAFNNLVAVDEAGNLHWTAETPDTHGDSYVCLVSCEPLIAQSFSGYRCTIDPRTGEITHREFTK